MHQKTCFCGKLKIKTPARPLLHFVCHCKDCDALWNGLYMGLVFPNDEIELSGGCCQTNENSHRIAGAALIYALNSWRHSVRAAVRLILKLSRE